MVSAETGRAASANPAPKLVTKKSRRVRLNAGIRLRISLRVLRIFFDLVPISLVPCPRLDYSFPN
jgi:hypothetical protein